MKNEFGGQIMKEFAGLKVEAYSYLKDNNDEDKKAKDTKNVIKTVQNSSNREKNELFKEKVIDVDRIKEDQKEFAEKNNLILKKKATKI